MRPTGRITRPLVTPAALAALTGAALLIAPTGPVQAAPLDALLDVRGDPDAGPGLRIELDRDLANDRLDVFGWRSDAGLGDTRIGDYSGRQLRLDARAGAWTLTAHARQRAIVDTGRTHQFRSWQLGLQHDFGRPGDTTRWGLRLNRWGDSATQVTRSTSSHLVASGVNAQLTELQLQRPRDQQTQLDLIGRQQLALPGLALSGFAGIGRSRVSADAASARATIAGCSYLIDFGPERLTAEPPDGCDNAPTVSVPNALLPYDALAETNYRARLLHAGGALHWQINPDWQLSAGLEWQRWQRDGVDARLSARGGHPVTDNLTLITELRWRFAPHLSALLRAQAMRHQLLGELPLAYNGLTASRFSQKYGLVSAGMSADF